MGLLNRRRLLCFAVFNVACNVHRVLCHRGHRNIKVPSARSQSLSFKIITTFVSARTCAKFVLT